MISSITAGENGANPRRASTDPFGAGMRPLAPSGHKAAVGTLAHTARAALEARRAPMLPAELMLQMPALGEASDRRVARYGGN
jgi:hypothetical protein